MDAEAVFKRYDIRGEYKEEIDEEFAERLGKAVGTVAIRDFGGEVTVCRDNKTSSIALKQSLVQGIISTGADIYDAGKGPTDYAALTGRKFNTLSVEVTSSHLPLDSNGFKLMYPEGNGFKNSDLHRIEKLFKRKDFEKGVGNSTKVEKASKKVYMEELSGYVDGFPGEIEGKKVVVESLGGASRELLPRLLGDAGAEVIDLSEDRPKGPYYDPPKPEPERLEHLENAVKKNNAYIGVSTDMDADRAVFYFKGSWITGDEVFGVLTQLFDEPEVVASIDTSKAVEDVVKENGGQINYTRVGDPFVIDEALEKEAEIGGEPNGHYCFPEFVPYNSGILTALMMTKIDLEQILGSIPAYSSENRDIGVTDKDKKLEKVRESVRSRFEVLSEIDGIKYKSGGSTVLIRSSGSSEVLRIKAESDSSDGALNSVETAEDIIRNS